MTGSEPRSAEAIHAVRRRVVEVLDAFADRVPADDGLTDAVDALRASGAFGILQPARFGGLEASPVAFGQLVREAAAICPATGWLVAFLGVSAWHCALLPEQAQTELWGSTANSLVCSAHAPVGRLCRQRDGFVLSGRWGASAGARFADWALLTAVEIDRDARPVDAHTVLVPRADLTLGESGTGGAIRHASHELSTHELFVPAHRVMRTFEVNALEAPGRETNPGPLYHLPWGLMYGTAASAPVIGAAEGCYRTVVDEARELGRLTLGWGGPEGTSVVHELLGEASSEIEAAVLQTEHNLEAVYAAALAGTAAPAELRLRARRDQARATRRAVAGVDLLLAANLGLSPRATQRLERAWREVHVAARHRANDARSAFRRFGSGELGHSVEDDLY